MCFCLCLFGNGHIFNCYDKCSSIRKPRTAMDFSYFYAQLSHDDYLSRYLDITKIVFCDNELIYFIISI